MTLAEREALVISFTAIVEDLISATNRRFYLNDGSTYPDDGRVETAGTPWTSTAAVLAVIPVGLRTPYLTVNVMGVEYWFLPDGSLVDKIGSLSLIDGSVTLAKMANMATASVIYRKSAGTGPPEVQTLATLRTDLAIPDNVDMSLYVLAVSGYSLVLDSLISLIHAPGSDNQDLSMFVIDPLDGSRLINPDEIIKLAALNPVYDILLANNTSVASRVLSAVETTDYPTGWTLAASGDNPNDLIITHNLAKRIAEVKIFSVDGSAETMLWFNDAYSGIVAPDQNTLLIKNLATIELPIVIHLIFA